MSEPLSQRVALMIEEFMVNHAFFFIILALLVIVVIDFYNRYFRIVNTDNIDLMKEYSNLQLRRRYKL